MTIVDFNCDKIYISPIGQKRVCRACKELITQHSNYLRATSKSVGFFRTNEDTGIKYYYYVEALNFFRDMCSSDGEKGLEITQETFFINYKLRDHHKVILKNREDI